MHDNGMFGKSGITRVAMLIYLYIKIPHLQIAHQGGNLEVGNIKIHPYFKVSIQTQAYSPFGTF